MSTHAKWLDERGADYIARIQRQQCSFLSEISTSPEELRELFANLCALGFFRTDEQWACLSVAPNNRDVVHMIEEGVYRS